MLHRSAKNEIKVRGPEPVDWSDTRSSRGFFTVNGEKMISIGSTSSKEIEFALVTDVCPYHYSTKHRPTPTKIETIDLVIIS